MLAGAALLPRRSLRPVFADSSQKFSQFWRDFVSIYAVLSTNPPKMAGPVPEIYRRIVSLVILNRRWYVLIIMDAVNYLAFDTMTTVSFDSDFDTIRNPENRYPIGALEESNVRLGVLLQEAKLTSFNLDKYLFPASIIGRNQFVGFLRKLLKKRLQAVGLSDGKDIFSFLKDCKDPDTGAELTPIELSTETALFVVAGKRFRFYIVFNLMHGRVSNVEICFRI